VRVTDGRLVIAREGNVRKFVGEVEHRTFSGEYALRRGQPVLYVTERCVFRLTCDGLELAEVAPGIDIGRDVLAHMDFEPIIRDPQLMDASIFAAGPIGPTRSPSAEAIRRPLQLRSEAENALH